MSEELGKYLIRTRISLTEACKALGLDPLIADPETLDVKACDNCGFWDNPVSMIKDKDGTIYCRYCDDISDMRF